MLEKITQWHQSRIQKRLIHAYRVFMGLSLLPLVLTGLSHGPVVLAICLLTSQVFFAAIAYAYYSLQKTRVRESAFELDRIFDGHDFFPTTLEYQQTPGVVGEQFMELAQKRLDAIVSESPLINFSRELLRTAVYGLILLILLLLVPPMVNAVRSIVSDSGSTGQSEGQEDSQNQQDKGKDSDSESESESTQDQSQNGEQAGQDNSKEEKPEEGPTPAEGEGSEQGKGSEGEKSEGEKTAQETGSEGKDSNKNEDSKAQTDPANNPGQPENSSPTAQAGTGQTNDAQTPKQPQSNDPVDSQAESEKTSDTASTEKPTGQNELKPSSAEKQGSQGQGDVDAGDPVQEEIEKIQAMTVQTVKIESVKQKLEGIITRPGVPRKYRDKLKMMFENKERFPGSN